MTQLMNWPFESACRTGARSPRAHRNSRTRLRRDTSSKRRHRANGPIRPLSKTCQLARLKYWTSPSCSWAAAFDLNVPGVRRRVAGHACCKAIDNQSQITANRSHDHLCVSGSQYGESERRDCGGRALPCAGSPAPFHDDKLRKMLRNCLRDDPRTGSGRRLFVPADPCRRRIDPCERDVLAFAKIPNKNNLKSVESRRLWGQFARYAYRGAALPPDRSFLKDSAHERRPQGH